MNPFSPLYYLRQNMARILSLVLVMSMTALCYLIGLYVSNPYDESMKNIEFYKDFEVIAPRDDSESRSRFDELFNNITNYYDGDVMNVDYYNASTILGNISFVDYTSGMLFNTVMGYRGGTPFPVFNNAKDFSKFTKVLGLPYTGGDKAIIMGEKLAKQFDLKIGGSVWNDWDRALGFKNKLTLTDIYTKSDYGVPGAYTCFRLDSAFKPVDATHPNAILLLRDFASNSHDIKDKQDKLNAAVSKIKLKFQDQLMYIDYKHNSDELNAIFAPRWPYFGAVIAVIGAALALTAIGIFSVTIQKRDFEFSIYSAIGFLKFRIIRKCIAEVLLMNLISIAIGVVAILITVSSLNDLVLLERGQQLYYYSDMAFFSYILCNLAVTIPLIIMQTHKILKSNVVRY